MSKKKDRKIRQTKIRAARSYENVQLENMNIKDLKRNCIVRGMPFEMVVQSGIPDLESWFIRNGAAPIDHELLDQFDNWVEEYLQKERGIDPNGPNGALLSPMLRLGFFGEDEDGNVKVKRIKGIKKKKKKRKKTEDGIFAGTKKALTFECVKRGLSKEETIKKVTKEFPEAKDKSIGIWYNSARKRIEAEG